MNDLSRILRFWLFLPIVFISLAAVLVTAVITIRAAQLEKESREAQKQAIESHVFSESAKIAEEVYLRLDNWSAREKQIATSFQGRVAKIKLRFEPSDVNATSPPSAASQTSWTDHPTKHDQEILSIPLFFGDIFLGNLVLDLKWADGWSVGGFSYLGATILGVLVCLILGWLVTFVVFRRRVFSPLLERLVRLNRLEAISETTQMIAHDVRKPFYLLRLCLQSLQGINDLSDAKALIDSSASTIDKVSSDVEDMLRDIVDLEKPEGRHRESISITDLIEATVLGSERLQDEKDCAVSLEFSHRHRVSIDPARIQRVLENLLRNALQAVERGGRIWIRTTEQEERRSGPVVTVCIGNSGATISTDDIPRLFDRFFTKGKPDGTGLGLAIANKFVTSHGGKIWCRSTPETGTEFFFSLPGDASGVLETLPLDSSARPQKVDHGSRLMPRSTPDVREGAIKAGTSATSPQSIANDGGRPSPIRVALIGNDRFYLAAMEALLSTYAAPGGLRAEVKPLSIKDGTLLSADADNVDLVIVDCDGYQDTAALHQFLSDFPQSVAICLQSSSLKGPAVRLGITSCIHVSKPMDSAKIESLLRCVLSENTHTSSTPLLDRLQRCDPMTSSLILEGIYPSSLSR